MGCIQSQTRQRHMPPKSNIKRKSQSNNSHGTQRVLPILMRGYFDGTTGSHGRDAMLNEMKKARTSQQTNSGLSVHSHPLYRSTGRAGMTDTNSSMASLHSTGSTDYNCATCIVGKRNVHSPKIPELDTTTTVTFRGSEKRKRCLGYMDMTGSNPSMNEYVNVEAICNAVCADQIDGDNDDVKDWRSDQHSLCVECVSEHRKGSLINCPLNYFQNPVGYEGSAPYVAMERSPDGHLVLI